MTQTDKAAKIPAIQKLSHLWKIFTRALYINRRKIVKSSHKGWGLSVKLGKHSAIWGKLGTALQAFTLNPCTKFPPNPTSRKVNT